LLDACHIQTHALSGINSPSNGIALCKNLHAAFDNGLISLADDFSVLVSRQVRENKTAYSLLPLAGTKIHLPTQERFQPARDHLEWHRTQWGF
jgi:putative restriction endonuclease